MKFKLLILSMFCSLFSFGQMQDLAKLADGKLIFNTTLFDSEENLYGYFYIYQIDTKDSKTLNYEYVVLDKNLNKVNNGTFDGPKDKFMIEARFNDCTLMGDKLILDKLYLNTNQGSIYIFLNTIQIISLKDNSVSNEKQLLNNELIDFDKSKLKVFGLSAAKSRYYISAFSNNVNSGFFVVDANNDKAITFFNSNFEKQWTYAFNGKDSLNISHSDFKIKTLKDSVIYATEACYDKSKKTTSYKILAIDFKTGKKKYDYEMNSDKDKLYHTYETFKTFENKLVVMGYFSDNIGYLDFRSYYKGQYKLTLDANGKELEKIYHPWKDYNPIIKLSDKGRTKNSYRLNDKKYFIFDDGSISIVNEMYKPARNALWFVPFINLFTAASQETSDFLVFNYDKSFNLVKVDTISKRRQYDNGTDYLFSQSIKGNKGFVFFNTNMQKDEKTGKLNLMLGINSIVNGNLTQELIPMYQKKKYIIRPMLAKEGYIMLREYNEKDKYNQIRLEKLNY